MHDFISSFQFGAINHPRMQFILILQFILTKCCKFCGVKYKLVATGLEFINMIEIFEKEPSKNICKICNMNSFEGMRLY